MIDDYDLDDFNRLSPAEQAALTVAAVLWEPQRNSKLHLDPWWNPAVEDQASDRAHRIGQTRPVTIYRLVIRDSVEEGILDLHTRKRELSADILDGAQEALAPEDLLTLIRSGLRP